MKYISLLAAVVFYLSNPGFTQLKYPQVAKVPFDTVIQGTRLSDSYFWLSRNENKPALQEYSKQQGTLALSLLDSIPGMEQLQNESGEVYNALQDEIWNLALAGESIYYYRDIPKEGPTLCRRKGEDAPEEKILRRVTINGQSYSVRKRAFAYNKPLLALMLTQQGERNPQIRIFDLEKKVFLPDSIAPVMFNDSRGVSMAWLPGDKGILYSQAPPTDKHAEKYFNGKIRQHEIGTSALGDKEIFGIGLNRDIALKSTETPYIYSFKNSPYLLARIRSGSGDNYAFAVHKDKLNGSKTPWVRLKDYINLGDAFDARGKFLFAATTGSPRYRIVKIDMESGARPEEFLGEQADVIAGTDSWHNSGIVSGKDALYILMRRIGAMQILKVDYTGRATLLPIRERINIAELKLKGENDLVFLSSSPTKSFRYLHYSYSKDSITPLAFATRYLDKSNELVSEVLMVPSRDGKMIPLSVVRSVNTSLQQNNPFIIEGYGNAGRSEDMHFNPSYFSWIKRGGIYAYAHVRGGGELGEDWYLNGQYPHKMNSVNDFVDIAQWLVKNNYSSPSKLFIMGASAGSFLVGNAINQRPDLFAGGIYLAGLPDLATHSDAAAAREEKSIGPKTTKEGFFSNYEHSALYHIPKGKALPSMLIIHGATDYILAMHPAARYAATLQERQQGKNPILFLTDWEGGHVGSENEIFYILKFALWQSGHPDFQLNQ
ncbi:prolyl oligopeptidase family serine peptidase [Flavihumibacter solisilvae]|uniref:Peptidase S9 n=1 Tax=Flavihumibacter solisilvae TaxID=1349421 RepID=A0A0C1L7S9_9BACT|nr:prolyl oligopeptidase family serine peptidase [Flavihumibacter solisilvae]KIC96207.1 hypothetical protein OI18_00040 [Flavihumibacter solisilvae]